MSYTTKVLATDVTGVTKGCRPFNRTTGVDSNGKEIVVRMYRIQCKTKDVRYIKASGTNLFYVSVLEPVKANQAVTVTEIREKSPRDKDDKLIADDKGFTYTHNTGVEPYFSNVSEYVESDQSADLLASLDLTVEEPADATVVDTAGERI